MDISSAHEKRPLPEKGNAPRINLALQGGGAHGAFTWGVLDALLADPRIAFEGVSGTSAGAMNAVAMAHGFAIAAGKDAIERRESAREALSAFWNGVIAMGSVAQAQKAAIDIMLGGVGLFASPANAWMNSLANEWTQSLSPYEANPLDINPLRDLLERQIDFERLQHAHELKIFVVATRVSTGQAEVFSGKRLSAQAVLASACLPQAFHAVEIDGDHYWDGGYSGNPAIHPLIYECTSRDVLLVQINPTHRDKLPTNSTEIMDRVNEITFNAGLIAEMRAIDFVKRLLAEGKLDPAHYKDVLLHRIDGGIALQAYPGASKIVASEVQIREWRDMGRAATRDWLKHKLSALGVQSTINIKRDYLDDLRVPVSHRPSHPASGK